MAKSETTTTEKGDTIANGKASIKSFDDLDDLPDIKCDICETTFSNVASYENHINGKKHYRKIQAQRFKNVADDDNNSQLADGVNSSEESSDTIYCNLCKSQFSGYIPYQQHLKSSKHTKQLNKAKLKDDFKNTPEVLSGMKISEGNEDLPKPYGKCDICFKTFYSPESLKQHMKSPGHAKKVSQTNMKADLRDTVEKNEDSQVVIRGDETVGSSTNQSFAECRPCGKKFSGPESVKMHMVSSAHHRRVEMQKLEVEMKANGSDIITDGKYLCKESGKTFLDFISLKQHLDLNVHSKKNVKKEVADFLQDYPEITVLPPVAEEGSGAVDEMAELLTDFYVCRFCRSSFTGPGCAKQHVMGKKHKRVKEILSRFKDSAASEASLPPTDPSQSKGKLNSESFENEGTKDAGKNTDTAAIEPEINDDFELIG